TRLRLWPLNAIGFARSTPRNHCPKKGPMGPSQLVDLAVDVDRREWDRFSSRQTGFTHCHLSGWQKVIERVFGHECLQLQERDAEGLLEGILPLVLVKSALFGNYLVSMPFLNY